MNVDERNRRIQKRQVMKAPQVVQWTVIEHIPALRTGGGLSRRSNCSRGAVTAPFALPLAAQQPPGLDIPYVPSPPEVVAQMLALANRSRNDVLYDLGSGDGRIVIEAARRFGTRGVGVDLDSVRVEEATANARRRGVQDRVRFRRQDLFETDLRPATIVTLYLFPQVNLELRPKLFEQLRPGTRVVSHAFNMGDWEPDTRGAGDSEPGHRLGDGVRLLRPGHR
jgi:hypothetical protein